MKNPLKRFLIPNRFDACFFAVALHWVTALLTISVFARVPFNNVSSSSLPSIVAAGLTWVGMSAALCWKPISWARVMLLVASSILSLIFVIVWLAVNFEVNTAQIFLVQVAEEGETVGSFLTSTMKNTVIAIALAAAVWLFNRFAIFLFSNSKAKMQSVFKSLGGDRSRFMIGLASALFVIAIISRVVSSLTPDGNLGFGSVEIALQIPLFAAGWLIALVWFPRSFSLEGMPVQKFFSALICIIAGFFVCLAVQSGRRPSPEEILIPFIGSVVFLFSVVSVGKSKQEKEHSADSLPRIATKPSLIGVAPLALLAGCAMLPSFFDIGIYATHDGTLNQRFDHARLAARIYNQTDGQVRAVPTYWSGSSIWQANFSDDSDSDVLEALANERIVAIEIHHMNPRIDLDAIANSGGFVSLVNSEISKTQLQKIMQTYSRIDIRGELKIVDDGSSLSESALSNLSFQNCPPGTIQAIVDSADGNISVASIQVLFPITEADWPAIELLAQSGEVHLYAGIGPDFEIPLNSSSLANVILHPVENSDGTRPPIRKELVLKSNIVVYLHDVLSGKPEMACKLLMLRDSSVHFDLANWLATARATSGESLEKILTETKLAYEFGDSGEVKSVFLPRCVNEPEIAKLTGLRMLSFDETWVVGMQKSTSWAFASSVGPMNVSYLKSLTHLEELYFDNDFVPADTAFLRQLPVLKHLQVPRIERKVTGPIGFDACKSLESITFLAKPDSISVRELAKVKALKRFVIANLEDDKSIDDAYLAKLRKVLAGVEVSVISKEKIGSLVPESFKQHREKIRKELRADTAWLDELLSNK